MSKTNASGESEALREARGLKGGWVERFGSEAGVIAHMMRNSMTEQNLPHRAAVYHELEGLVRDPYRF
ncbi:hypothetical protein KZ810_02740 [Sphingomonas sp. RHCKR47]|uniref:hypothetical protein n=1 Tax=Sphingomonas citricola TaxID=2862498 RepID=UPI001CA5F15E|nr:hypothetical protein [Sphingomonas citricola]MBW6522405.1 hypothetical protein [Sphingomonas citricola]